MMCRCKKCGHEFYCSFEQLKARTMCPECKKRYLSEKYRLSIEEVKEKLKEVNKTVKIVSDEYINSKTKLKCECTVCGNEFMMTWNDLRSGNNFPDVS